jgi:tetratricopeptide (TPR) repeat protein
LTLKKAIYSFGTLLAQLNPDIIVRNLWMRGIYGWLTDSMAEKEHNKMDAQDQGLQPDRGEGVNGQSKASVPNDMPAENTLSAQEPEFEPFSTEVQRIINGVSKPRRHYSRFQLMVALNVVVLVVIVCLIVLTRHTSKPDLTDIYINPYQQQSAAPQASQNTSQSPESPVSAPSVSGGWNITEKQAEALEQAISLTAARQLYMQQDYPKACYMFKKLQERLLGDGLEEECLREWLSLQMARCFQKTNDFAMMDELFMEVLSSKSIVLRAMANYHIALVHAKNQQYYEAYSRIYRALALLKAFQKQMPASMEADCYFIAAESLTRHILRMNNDESGLPGSSWMDDMEPYELPVHNQEKLAELLVTGIDKMNNVALTPKVEFYADRKVGSQWSIICLNAPIEQIFWQFASESEVSVNWGSKSTGFDKINITAFLPFVDRHYLAEVLAGSAGLIWQYDGQNGTIYNPAGDSDFDNIRGTLVQEAVSMWQRYIIRYRNNHRTSNAHFCLGRLYEMTDQKTMALGAYKLVSTQFDQDMLAAYALFNTAMFKVDMRDYKGAKGDLKELLIRYPDCMIVDQALMYLAEVLMQSGFYTEAAQTYDRVLHLELNTQAHQKALYGSGRCAYEMGDFETAAERFAQMLEVMTDKSDDRFGSVCFMLGQAYINLEQYVQASGALRMALGKMLDRQEYIPTVIELARVECKRERYLEALSVLNNISTDHLNQEDSCRVLIAKVNVYRAIGLEDAAISLLRRQIEYIAEASLRAQLTLELAQCYMLNGDLQIAEKELNDAMYDLSVGHDSQRGGHLLAEIAFRQKEYDKAGILCRETLETNVDDENLRLQIYQLLGQTYARQQDYDNAALAFAGLMERDSIQ